MLNVVGTLQQCCGNILKTSESDDVTTSETDVGTTLIFDSSTTLWQSQQRRCDNVVTTSLCQLGYNERNISLRHTGSRSLVIFLKVLYELNGSGLQLSFNIFRSSSTWHTIKTNCIKNLGYWSRHCVKYRSSTQFPGVEILQKCTVSAELRASRSKLCGNCTLPQNFHTRKLGEITVFYVVRELHKFRLFRKGPGNMGIVSSPRFVNDFSRKMFLMLYFINWPNLIVWMPLLLEILCNMCIAVICYQFCNVINFEIKLMFLIESFFYMIKKLKTKI